jgi:hypothetical protein
MREYERRPCMARRLIFCIGVIAAIFTAIAAPASAESCRNGRSTDPNCYRNNGYVCGPCYSWRESWRRRQDRGCINGRSTDPNCYRPQGYVCGPCNSGRSRWRGDDDGRGRGHGCERGRSTDPNCYRGRDAVYVCGPCYD